MPAQTIIRRLLDAGMQFSEMSQSTAEKLVSEFVKTGQLRRKEAEQTVQALVERGRSSTERLVATVQSEVGKQLGRFADRIDGIEDRIEDLAESAQMMARRTSTGATTQPAGDRKSAASPDE